MSTCSLQQIFEKDQNLESLSWKPMQHSSSLTEIFGELHFNESPIPSPSSSPHISSSSSFSDINTTNHSKLINQNEETHSDHQKDIIQTPSSLPYISTNHKSCDSFSSLSSESLQICTESLCSESSDDVEEYLNKNINEVNEQKVKEEEKNSSSQDLYGQGLWKSRSLREYPPPISCIGRSGKPSVSFKCYRNNGRLILKEIRIPKQDFLHAHREDGRLKLHFIQPAQEEDDEEEEEYLDDEDYEGEESEDEGEGNQGSVADHANEEKRD